LNVSSGGQEDCSSFASRKLSGLVLSVGSWGFGNVCNVGGVSFFFFAEGRKKQNKFPSNLHCPVIKLNHFLFQIVNIVSVWSSVFLHLLPTPQYPQPVASISALGGNPQIPLSAKKQ